jgi:cytosine/adenosine deaminase-related metal-dependent hydrolase
MSPADARAPAAAYRAAWALLPGGVISPGIAVETAGGVITRVGPARGTEEDLGRVLLLPGLVNAHVHLELSGFSAIPAAGSFPVWGLNLGIRRSLAGMRRLAEGARSGVDRLLAEGVTCVGELATVGAASDALRRRALSGVWFREMIRPRAAHAARELLGARVASARERQGTRLREGLFPHATYSCSALLHRAAAECARACGLRYATHAGETRWETALFDRPTERVVGFERFLSVRRPHRSRGMTPVAWLAAAGALTGCTTLVHAAHMDDADVRAVGQSGAAVVVCPRSSIHFGETPADVRRLLDAGVTVALGTDSPASGGSPSLRAEMRSLAELQPGLGAAVILRMATEYGARALGLEGACGALAPGARADLATIDLDGDRGDPAAAILRCAPSRTVTLGGWPVGVDGSQASG